MAREYDDARVSAFVVVAVVWGSVRGRPRPIGPPIGGKSVRARRGPYLYTHSPTTLP